MEQLMDLLYGMIVGFAIVAMVMCVKRLATKEDKNTAPVTAEERVFRIGAWLIAYADGMRAAKYNREKSREYYIAERKRLIAEEKTTWTSIS